MSNDTPRVTRAGRAAAAAAAPQPVRGAADADEECALAGKLCSHVCLMCDTAAHGCTPRIGDLKPAWYRIRTSAALTLMTDKDGHAVFDREEIAEGKVCVHGRDMAVKQYNQAGTPAPKMAPGRHPSATSTKAVTRGVASGRADNKSHCPLCKVLRGKDMRWNERPGFATGGPLNDDKRRAANKALKEAAQESGEKSAKLNEHACACKKCDKKLSRMIAAAASAGEKGAAAAAATDEANDVRKCKALWEKFFEKHPGAWKTLNESMRTDLMDYKIDEAWTELKEILGMYLALLQVGDEPTVDELRIAKFQVAQQGNKLFGAVTGRGKIEEGGEIPQITGMQQGFAFLVKYGADDSQLRALKMVCVTQASRTIKERQPAGYQDSHRS